MPDTQNIETARAAPEHETRVHEADGASRASALRPARGGD